MSTALVRTVPNLILEQSLPDNLDAERFVLGAILSDATAYLKVAAVLAAEDFSLEKHRRIFLRMTDLYDREEKIDRVTLVNELSRHGQLQSVDGLSYITSLDDGMPRVVNLESYVDIVKEKALLRRIIMVSQDTISRCMNCEDEAHQILGNVEDALMKLGDARIQNAPMNPAQIITSYEGGLNAFLDTGRRIKGISTGFLKFDEMTGGLREGELLILAARPAMGKTSLALNIAQHVASDKTNPKAVVVFSLEMSKESLLTRMVCALARVDQQRFRAGYLNVTERRDLQQAFHEIAELPLFIDDTAGTNLMDIHSKCRRLQAENDLGLVVIDYLQLMQGRGRFETRVQEISSLSRGFKLMSKELKVPFLVLSQLSRAPETRPGDHRPILSDLRESGCLVGDTLIADAETGVRIPIRDVQPGMKVWAINDETLKLDQAVVSHSFSTGTKRVFTVKTKLGRTIQATANHKFKTWDGWKPLSEIKRGQRIAIPREIQTVGSNAIRECEAALLGHMIGNGCMLPRHCIQYTGGDKEICEVVAGLATECFGSEVAPRVNPERTWFQVYLKSTRKHTHGVRSVVAEWLTGLGLFGKRSFEKFVPEAIFQQNAQTIGVFLKHLWSSDGCIGLGQKDHHPSVYYATSSPNLARDIQSLLLRLGVNARRTVAPQMAKGRQMFHVEISGKPDLLRFLDRVGVLGSKRNATAEQIKTVLYSGPANTNRDVIPSAVWKQYAVPAMISAGITSRQMMRNLNTAYCGTGLYKQNVSRTRALRLAVAVRCEQIRRLAESDIYWDQVVSVEYAGEKETFDLTVPDHHNFVADDIIAHNSIEQDADMVAFIFREEVYRPDKESLKGIAELILAKQRNGPTGRVKLSYLNRFTKFENLASEPTEEYD